jgi:hypothetical protein
MKSHAMSKDPPTGYPSDLLEILRQIHWAARQVLHGNLARPLNPATLERLRGSVSRQADQVRALRQTLAGTDLDDAVRAELVQLGLSFEAMEKEITRRIEPQGKTPRCDTDGSLSPSERSLGNAHHNQSGDPGA